MARLKFRGGKLLARSHPLGFALLGSRQYAVFSLPPSAIIAGCGQCNSYACKPSLLHSRHFPPLHINAILLVRPSPAPAGLLALKSGEEDGCVGEFQLIWPEIAVEVASETLSSKSLANRWVRRLRGRGGPQERETRGRSASRAARCKRDKRMSGKAENSDGWQKTSANAPVQASRISTH